MAPRSTYDVAIIGSGVIGCSISLHLSRLGYKVINVDAKGGAGHGTTSYSSGICRMFYSILDSVKFSWEGYHYWKDWENFIDVEDPRGFAKLREWTEPDCDPEEWVDGDIDVDMNLSLTENWQNYIYRVALRIPNLP